ncbi:MAG: BMP family ABC transporter substrate-binding protein [Lachnospiraceae bacterium]|nr:BMP family ABC transporter substrate-binding protein [Lachnospiraceae bacterium]
MCGAKPTAPCILRLGSRIQDNVPESKAETSIRELIADGCQIIFGTSYGYGEAMKRLAQDYPEIEFCQATGANANEEPVLKNYHTFMGTIYEGRYVSGVVAGMKLRELIEQGKVSPDEAKIGYVGAFPFAEVISGYTAFFLGVRSEVPTAVMYVRYTNTWSDYTIEKKYAKELIDEGCVIISQHSDTIGPAVACEETRPPQIAYHVGYNQSMTDTAPTTSLISSRIIWDTYIKGAIQAVMEHKSIEKVVKGKVNGCDISGGFKEGWIKMSALNETIAAKGTAGKMEKVIQSLENGKIRVFEGDYLGVNPEDPSDVYDLNKGYYENEKMSAPSFDYVLKDVIIVEQ